MSIQNSLKERTNINVKEPSHYCVVMHNDDFTTMEFVVDVLIDIFKKNEAEAEVLMMKVHHEGKAVVGKYPYDIALTKVGKALKRAQSEGFPFRMTVEEA